MNNIRTYLKASFVMLMTLGHAFSASSENRDITLQLAWLPNAASAGEIIAKSKGFFEEAGLNVTVLPGGPSANTIQEVLSGTADIAIGYAPQIMYAADKGLPVKSFGAAFQKAPLTFFSLGEKNIKSVADWKGMRVGANQSSAPQIAVLLDNAGLTLEDITHVQARVPALMQDQVDIVATWPTNVADIALIVEHPGGYNAQSIWDNGLQFQSNYYIALNDTLQNDSDMLNAYMAAVDKAWAWVADNQEEAVALLIEFAPALQVDKETPALAVIIEDYVYTDETLEFGFANVSRERWQQTLDRYAALGEVKDSLTADDVHDGSVLEAVSRTMRE